MRNILKTKHELQSGLDRQAFAELLIEQLPDTHDGRNTWLLNYGIREEAQKLRKKHAIEFSDFYQAAGK